jgi:hypothetical protein
MATSQERIREVERGHGAVPSALRRRGYVLAVNGSAHRYKVERLRLIVSDVDECEGLTTKKRAKLKDFTVRSVLFN